LQWIYLEENDLHIHEPLRTALIVVVCVLVFKFYLCCGQVLEDVGTFAIVWRIVGQGWRIVGQGWMLLWTLLGHIWMLLGLIGGAVREVVGRPTSPAQQPGIQLSS
jgi:hypothetical protein